MTDAPSTPPQATPAEAGHLDRLAKLHRMSRTAGLGSTDYAAVNTAAVLATIIGVASALSLITPVFLFVPVIGLVIAVIALKQVRQSNGTQTGLALAGLGLALSLGFTAVTGGKALMHYRERAADQATLNGLTQTFFKNAQENALAANYDAMHERFKERVPRTQFENFFNEQLFPRLGKINSVTPPALYEFDEDPESDARLAAGIAQLAMEKIPAAQPFKVELRFRREAGQWTILNVPEWFPLAPPSTPAGPMGPPR